MQDNDGFWSKATCTVTQLEFLRREEALWALEILSIAIHSIWQRCWNNTVNSNTKRSVKIGSKQQSLVTCSGETADSRTFGEGFEVWVTWGSSIGISL